MTEPTTPAEPVDADPDELGIDPDLGLAPGSGLDSDSRQGDQERDATPDEPLP
jgi:hypothetical protein